MGTQTHYQVLKIPPGATAEQIKRAYRGLAKTVHPDVNPSKDAARAFARLAAAYETLGSAVTRRAYDRKIGLEREDTGAGRAHYSWENVAAKRKNGTRVDVSEVDELYDAFFGRKGAGRRGAK